MPLSKREALRMAALRSYEVLDTAPEAVFDRLTELAAELFDAPMAVVSLVDEDRQWFKSRHGIEGESTPREWAFCAHAIEQEPRSVMVVNNALQDPRFRDNPLVTGAPDIRFYAGAVITGSDEQNLGTLCVIDNKPRTPSAKDLARLKTLAGLVANELELRRATRRVLEFQKTTERALTRMTEQANRARLAESIAGLGHWRIDMQSGHASWSDQMYLIHGMEPGSSVDVEAIKDLIHPEDRDTVTAWRETLFKTGVGPQIDLRIQHAGGGLIHLIANGAGEFDDCGRITAVIGTVWDVSELRRQTLEAEQAREAAQAAHKEAEEAAEVKAQFLANMSHELRTPLTSILGFMNLAGGQPELAELTRTYLARARDAGEALLCAVNDVLDFSKLEAGEVRFQPRPISLSALGRSTLELFSPQAGAKDLSLTFEMDGEDRVMADPDRLRQVLLNLVGNAVKFTGSGGVTLSLRYDKEAQRLDACVSDTGAGIAPDKVKALFKRFSQVDGSLSRAGGTGLGLAICKGLVEAQGGAIGVDSIPGRGSRFWFSLPMAPAHAHAADASTGGSKVAPGLRILVADDHPANRELARLFLEGVGAEVTEAVDGADAAAQACDWPFDLILMDIRMPKMDGLTALKRIRQEWGPNGTTPILAFTADADSREGDRLIAGGFDGVVLKPIDAHALFAAVAKATDYISGALAKAS